MNRTSRKQKNHYSSKMKHFDYSLIDSIRRYFLSSNYTPGIVLKFFFYLCLQTTNKYLPARGKYCEGK